MVGNEKNKNKKHSSLTILVEILKHSVVVFVLIVAIARAELLEEMFICQK